MTADELRRAIAAGGGLVNGAELARRWNVSRVRAHELVTQDDFPEPVAHVAGRPVWLFNEVDEWREKRRGG